jgi:hypothetical protein
MPSPSKLVAFPVRPVVNGSSNVAGLPPQRLEHNSKANLEALPAWTCGIRGGTKSRQSVGRFISGSKKFRMYWCCSWRCACDKKPKIGLSYSSLAESFIEEPEGNVLDTPPTAMTSIGTAFNDTFGAADSLHI